MERPSSKGTRRSGRLLLLAACVATSGCITGFKHPLGPASRGYIDDRLLGVWSCVAADDPGQLELSLVKFDSRQYYVRIADSKSEPSDGRAFATRLEETDFLNLHQIGPKADGEWTFLQYSVSEGGQLTMKYVDPQPFEDILDDPQAVRDRLASRLDDPEVVGDGLACARHELDPAKPEP